MAPPPRKHIQRGLVIGGAVLSGVSYFLLACDAIAIFQSSNGFSGPWLIPVAGPFIALGETNWCGGGCTSTDTRGLTLLILNGAAQVGGVAMLAYGLAVPVQRRKVTLTAEPVLGRNMAGVGFSGTF